MGQDITGQPAHRRLASGMGRTLQIPRPFPELTMLENMMLARQGQTGERFRANFSTPGKLRPRNAPPAPRSWPCWTL